MFILDTYGKGPNVSLLCNHFLFSGRFLCLLSFHGRFRPHFVLKFKHTSTKVYYDMKNSLIIKAGNHIEVCLHKPEMFM